MNTNVWAEAGGRLLKEALRQEARAWHQMHQPPTRLQDWIAGRERLRQRFLAASGTFPPPPELDVREHGTLKMDGYRIVRLTYQSRPDLRVTANLFAPDGAGPFPAVLNVHGHYPQGKIAANVAARGHTLASEGFVTLSVDAIGAGERGTVPGEFEYHGSPQGISLLSVGETLLGMQVYDNMRAIDLLQSLGFVDGTRIGVTGASGGGNQTMWLSALDPRVKASVPVVSVGTFESYVTNGNCWCEMLPDGLTIAEEWAALALVAPNPLLILTALREQIPAFVIAEMVRSYAAAREVYRLYGAEEKIACQAIDLMHGYFPEMRRHMLGWFKHWLQGKGSPLPCAIPKSPELPESKLMCFPGKSRPPEVKSLADYVRLRSRAAKKRLLTQSPINRRKKLAELKEMLRVRSGGDPVSSGGIIHGEEDGLGYEKFTVESEPNVLIPCTLLMPGRKRPSSIVIAAHPDGKEACLQSPVAQAVLTRGKALCLVDLRDIGESYWDPGEPLITYHFAARAALWLGRTMLGDWVKDLFAVRAALAKLHRATPVELMGFDEPALATLAAAALEKRFAGVTVSNLLSTYVITEGGPVQRQSIFVPGMLCWGDVSLLAALIRCPTKVNSLVHPSGRPLSAKESCAWRREVSCLSDRFVPQPRKE